MTYSPITFAGHIYNFKKKKNNLTNAAVQLHFTTKYLLAV